MGKNQEERLWDSSSMDRQASKVKICMKITSLFLGGFSVSYTPSFHLVTSQLLIQQSTVAMSQNSSFAAWGWGVSGELEWKM